MNGDHKMIIRFAVFVRDLDCNIVLLLNFHAHYEESGRPPSLCMQDAFYSRNATRAESHIMLQMQYTFSARYTSSNPRPVFQ